MYAIHNDNDRYNVALLNELQSNLESLNNNVTVQTHSSSYYVGDELHRAAFLPVDEVFPFITFDEPLPRNLANHNVLCDDLFVIENEDTNKIFAINVQDSSVPMSILSKCNEFAGAIDGFYKHDFVEREYNHPDKIIPGFYFPMFPSEVEHNIDEISKIEPTDQRMFFAGTIGYENGYVKNDGKPRREVVMILKDKHPDDIRVLDRNQKLDRVEWWKEAKKHYVNLSIPGGPWCNREFEFWGLGIPFIASFFKNALMTNPIPDYHYIAPVGGEREYNGVCIDAEFAADQIYKRYINVRDNLDYLQWIGNNGRQFYQKELTVQSIGKKYANIINNWYCLNN